MADNFVCYPSSPQLTVVTKGEPAVLLPREEGRAKLAKRALLLDYQKGTFYGLLGCFGHICIS